MSALDVVAMVSDIVSDLVILVLAIIGLHVIIFGRGGKR